MHEVSIVESLIEQVEQEVARAEATGSVSRLKLTIGRLSGVHTDSIRFAFDLLSPGTIVESAELVIEEPSAMCVCDECGRRNEIEELVLECPACGATEIAIDGVAPALASAIHDATGVWLRELPYTPERVWRALQER